MLWEACVEWTGSRGRFPNHYGYVVVDGQKASVHRAVWEAINGPLLPGECVLHRCDNPPCYNIRHLFKGSKKDNAIDRNRKGRAAARDGENNGRARLTEMDVRQIRRRVNAGERQEIVGLDYGINQGRVSSIALRRTWKTTRSECCDNCGESDELGVVFVRSNGVIRRCYELCKICRTALVGLDWEVLQWRRAAEEVSA